MTYDLSDQQVLFRDAVQNFLGQVYQQDARRTIVASNDGWSPAIWRGMAADIGVLGLGFEESRGGLGGNAVDQIPVMESFGQSLLVEPYLETVILAGRLLRRSVRPLAQTMIDGVIAGDIRLAVADREPESRFDPSRIETIADLLETGGYRLTGRKTVVVGAPWATHILVVARLSGRAHPSDCCGVFVVAVDAVGLLMASYPTVDGRRAADIELDGVVVAEEALLLEGREATDAVEEANDSAAAAICAEAVGIMRRLLRETHSYLNERRQFGVALATFQALQHRMADMLIALELSAALAYRAASAIDAGASVRRVAVSAAKAFVGRAAHRIGQEAVQMHGGMGMTDELIIGHLFKRAIAI
ncbi:acyl-CoA dehydrogenase family protein, partial [Sphingobium indicum]|uniref:acyl-CoA dehydrogenase family protein n=1 Tax=Sphingobium indicum TaxID=332055 RepID=UPI00056804D4